MRDPSKFWPYFTGMVFVLLCLVRWLRDRPLFRDGRFLSALSSICYAIPMAIFGAEHLSSPGEIMKIVPRWMPGRLFWTYFVGLCLIAAALSMAWRVRIRLSATLLGSMLFAFVAMIHLPNALASPGMRVLWIVAARDLAFACGAVILGITEGKPATAGQRAVEAMQLSVGAVAVFFGIQHFLHPECVPGVPLAKLIPAWVPLGHAWTYVTGVGLIFGGFAMFARSARRNAAAGLGMLVICIVLFFYIPLMIATPDVESLNYVADTLVFAGTLLAVASTTPRNSRISDSNADAAARLSSAVSK